MNAYEIGITLMDIGNQIYRIFLLVVFMIIL